LISYLRVSIFFTQPFHLSISSVRSSKHITILAVPPQFITNPEKYHSYISTQCFVQQYRLPSSDVVYEKDFGIVGVLGVDYAIFVPIRNILRTLELSTAVVRSGYDKFLSLADSVPEEWSMKDRLSKGPRPPRPLKKAKKMTMFTLIKPAVCILSTTITTRELSSIVTENVNSAKSVQFDSSPKIPCLPLDPSLRNAKRQFVLTPRLGIAKHQKVTNAWLQPRVAASRKRTWTQLGSKRLSLGITKQNTRFGLRKRLDGLKSNVHKIWPSSSGITIGGSKESMAVKSDGEIQRNSTFSNKTSPRVIDKSISPDGQSQVVSHGFTLADSSLSDMVRTVSHSPQIDSNTSPSPHPPFIERLPASTAFPDPIHCTPSPIQLASLFRINSM
jgi:hypothetical protein